MLAAIGIMIILGQLTHATGYDNLMAGEISFIQHGGEHAGETIVVEVNARRLSSPFDSFVKVTGANGKIIALNDDHYDAASGLNTDHADSYLMAKLPSDGKYFVHLGDTRRHGHRFGGTKFHVHGDRGEDDGCDGGCEDYGQFGHAIGLSRAPHWRTGEIRRNVTKSRPVQR